MAKGFTLLKTVASGSTLTLPPSLIDRLLLEANQPATIRCGSAKTQAVILADQSDDSIERFVGLSGELLKSLRIPSATTLSIKPDENNNLCFGPVVGLLAFSTHVPDRLFYYKAYANAAKNKLLFFVFKKGGIDYTKNTITGYYFNHLKNYWEKHEFPLPDVVLDRRYPNSDKTRQLLAYAIGKDKIFNNKTMINKSQFHKILIKDSYLKDFLPETRPLRHPRDLSHFLSKYQTVILKPVNAMKGSGIVAVTRNSSNELACRFKIEKTDTVHLIKAPEQIPSILKMAAGRERKYLVQQGISCLEYCGGPFSLRTCPTKNGEGRWVIPGMLALASLGKSVVTNYSAGAERVPLNSLFAEILPKLSQSKEQFLANINDLTIRASVLLDQAYGPLGELGMDIIIDKNGKPWLLEANGNPGRIPIFHQTEYPLWPSQLYSLPLDYASYLAGFNQPECL